MAWWRMPDSSARLMGAPRGSKQARLTPNRTSASKPQTGNQSFTPGFSRLHCGGIVVTGDVVDWFQRRVRRCAATRIQSSACNLVPSSAVVFSWVGLAWGMDKQNQSGPGQMIADISTVSTAQMVSHQLVRDRVGSGSSRRHPAGARRGDGGAGSPNGYSTLLAGPLPRSSPNSLIGAIHSFSRHQPAPGIPTLLAAFAGADQETAGGCPDISERLAGSGGHLAAVRPRRRNSRSADWVRRRAVRRLAGEGLHL